MVDSEPRRSTRVVERPAQIFSTTDTAPIKKKFSAVSKWSKEQLDLLNVKFIKEEFDLNTIPGFQGNISPELQDGMC